MGWTSYNAPTTYNPRTRRYEIDRKSECDKLFSDDMITWDSKEVIGKFEVLKSSMVGSTYYAAVKRTKFATETEPEQSSVFAAVVLTSTNMKDYYNFSYKDMDETCGPYKYDCPKGILDLLTPIDSEYANNWRALCYENLKKKHEKDSLGKLPIGSVIKYQRHDGEEITCYKHPAAYQFKRPFWMVKDRMQYVKVKNIPNDYEVIKRGEC